MAVMQVPCPEQVEDEAGSHPCNRMAWVRWPGKGEPPVNFQTFTQCPVGHGIRVTASYIKRQVEKAKVLK